MRKWIFLLIIIPNMVFAHPVPLSRAVGQNMMVGFWGTTLSDKSPIVQAIKNYHIAGVLLLRHSYSNKKRKMSARNIKNPKQLRALTKQLQFYAKKYHDYPLLIATNQEGGTVQNLTPRLGFKTADLMSQQDLGSKNNVEAVYQHNLHRARLLKSYGINLNFAPVADLNVNPTNPGIGKLERSFSADPDQVTRDLTAVAVAYRKVHELCTLKHFPGLGSATANPDYDPADVTATWTKKELKPYRLLIALGVACPMIMDTHLVNKKLDPSGVPATLSRPIITGILRHKLHYQGVIITDDMDATAIRKFAPMQQVIKQAVLAGNNIILYGGTFGYDPMQDAKVLHATLMQLGRKDPKARRQIYRSYRLVKRMKGFMYE